MKHKKTLFAAITFLALGALVGCRRVPPLPPVVSSSGDGEQTDTLTEIDFWTGFGAAVNNVLEPLIERFEEQNENIKVNYEKKGGYDSLTSAIKESVSNRAYPHIANGYPDHFADYAASNVLLNLNSNNFIKNPDHGIDMEDFYGDYRVENETIVDGYTVGIPFNKSTEILVANQSFFDVANSIDDTIKVPATWQELADIGPKLRALVLSEGWPRNLVKHDGTVVLAKDIPVEPTPEFIESIAFDMRNVNEEATNFIPFNWDSKSNFFITILRQWDSTFTERGDTFHSGWIRFHEGEDRTKAKAALSFMKQLYDAKLIGIPETFGEGLYGSKPFREGRSVLTISSSAGVKENIPSQNEYPFKASINPILYNAELPNRKAVISQGTNLALFTRGSAQTEEGKRERLAAWKFLRFLTYEVNHEFGIGTSYFPVTDGSKLEESDERYADYAMYRDFLASEGGTAAAVATRDTAVLNDEIYMNPDEQWIKFVDPAFIGSSKVRTEVEYAMGYLFSGKTPDQVIDDLVGKLGTYVQ